MIETPLISVIVPVYKVEPYLRKCVDSIINQTYKNLEIILVDDGSPDNCGVICDEYAAQDSRIRVIHKENGGVSSARNAGLDICTGDYIGFVDSDDWIESDWIGGFLRTINGCVDVIISDGAFFNLPFPVGFAKKETIVKSCFYPSALQESVEHIAPSVCLKLFRKELWNNIRFSESLSMGEDTIAWLQIAMKADSFYVVHNSDRYHYTENGASITHGISDEKNRKNDLRLAELIFQYAEGSEYEHFSVSSLIFHNVKYMLHCKEKSEFLRANGRIAEAKRPIKKYFKLFRKKYKIMLLALSRCPTLVWRVLKRNDG